MHLSSKENRLSDLLSRWHLNENNERLFYTESGLSPHDEIFIGDHLNLKYRLTVTSFYIFTARRGVSILKQEVRQSQRAAYSKGTFKNLKTQITSYLLFCECFEIVALPASVETLCVYVQLL